MNILRLAGAIVLCQLAGALGAIATTPAIPTWYAELTKPSFSPPNYLFAPVWTILYVLMGISLYLVWQAKDKNKTGAYAWFFTQFGLT